MAKDDNLGYWIAGGIAAVLGGIALLFGSGNLNLPSGNGSTLPPSGGDFIPKKKGCGCSADKGY